jgi:CBS domain-containing protein
MACLEGVWTMKAMKQRHLRALDVMTSPVRTIEMTATVSGTARLLDEFEISGAPVVNERGEMIGMVSRTDLLAPSPRRTAPHKSNQATDLEEGDLARLMDADAGPNTLVAEVCTPFVITADPSVSVEFLASLMVAKKVHRVVIVDGRIPIGIVTTFDLMKLMAGPVRDRGRPCLQPL